MYATDLRVGLELWLDARGPGPRAPARRPRAGRPGPASSHGLSRGFSFHFWEIPLFWGSVATVTCSCSWLGPAEAPSPRASTQEAKSSRESSQEKLSLRLLSVVFVCEVVAVQKISL